MKQEVRKKPKLKARKLRAENEAITLDIAESFDVANAKDKDFDLDLDGAQFTGKKGQCGSRRQSAA